MKASEKALQEKFNMECVNEFNNAMRELDLNRSVSWHRLYNCNARYCVTDNYAILQSYSTIIAVQNLDTACCYDLLRCEYGYTATSAQHVSKFKHFFRALNTYTWRYVD